MLIDTIDIIIIIICLLLSIILILFINRNKLNWNCKKKENITPIISTKFNDDIEIIIESNNFNKLKEDEIELL